MIGLLFWTGAKLIVEYNLEFKGVYMAQFILLMTAVGAGNSLSAVPSISKAKASANKIFNVIDEKSLCDVRDTEGKIEKVEAGKIELRNVTFNYPSRTQNVLDNMSLTIEAG